MHTEQIITLLIQERDKLTRAIEALQGPTTLAPTKRRGRPPKNPAAIAFPTPAVPEPAVAPAPVRKKRRFSAAQRKAAGDRMRAMWAAKKAAAQPKKAAKRTKKKAATKTAKAA